MKGTYLQSYTLFILTQSSIVHTSIMFFSYFLFLFILSSSIQQTFRGNLNFCFLLILYLRLFWLIGKQIQIGHLRMKFILNQLMLSHNLKTCHSYFIIKFVVQGKANKNDVLNSY